MPLNRRAAALLSLFAVLSAQSASAQNNPVGCLPGVWDLQTINAGSGGPVQATSTRTCLLHGDLEVAEYRSFGPEGRVNFAGISLHAWNASRTGLTTLWLMVGDPGYTIIPTERDSNGTLWASGHGVDASGAFLERSVTEYDAHHNYHFQMERSSDSGATWHAVADIRGTHRSADVPPSPAALLPPYQRIRGTTDSLGIVVLDGMAELRTTTEMDDEQPVQVVEFSSVVGPAPPTWRTITWRLGAEAFSTKVQPAP